MAISQSEKELHVYTTDFTRGCIISLTITIERMIDLYTASYFIEDHKRKLELMEMIISDRMTWRAKTTAFLSILKKQHKKTRSKIEFKDKFPGLDEMLRNIGKDRNIFAHNMAELPTNQNDLKYPIILKIFSDKVTIRKFKQEEIDIIINRLVDCKNLLNKINNGQVEASSV